MSWKEILGLLDRYKNWLSLLAMILTAILGYDTVSVNWLVAILFIPIILCVVIDRVAARINPPPTYLSRRALIILAIAAILLILVSLFIASYVAELQEGPVCRPQSFPVNQMINNPPTA